MNHHKRFHCAASALVLLSVMSPRAAVAQSGKWVANIPTLTTIRGEARLSVSPENDKQSRAKLTIRASQGEAQIAWVIAEGRCGMNAEAVMPVAAFPRVTTRLDGSAEANPRIDKLVSGKQYYLRVFSAQKDPLTDSAAYGCANMSEEA